MAVEAETTDEQPHVLHNRAFMETLYVFQHEQLHEDDPNIFDVRFVYRWYGVDSSGKRHYKNEGKQLVPHEDFLKVAQQEAAQGNMEFMEAFNAIQKAFALMVKRHSGKNTRVI